MKYYVVADIHGFFDELITALDEKGFFSDAEPHKLIVCGDLFDRGTQVLELQEFILDLLAKDSVILIKGNHEDLTLELLNGWPKHSYLQYYHHTNGTIDTVLQLTKMTQNDLNRNPESVGRELLQNPYIQTVIPAMLDYFETPHYIFVHGWIPCTAINLAPHQTQYVYIDGWRNAHEKAWNRARWINGMEAAHGGVIEPGKTIICGHWHCSFGHAHYEGKGGEFDHDPDFTPYGVISGSLDIEEQLNKIGGFTVTFNCKPFKYSFAGQQTIAEGNPRLIVTNPTAFDSKPYIKIYGSGTVRLMITPVGHGTATWVLSDVDEYIEIDSELMNCFKDTVLKNDTVTGEGFPVLKPGENSIACAGNVRRVEVIPRWRCL